MTPFQYTVSSTGGPCPVGHYCVGGTGSPTPCPSGTYMATTQATGNFTYNGHNYFCTLCPPGRVCEGSGLTASTGACPSGYWCTIGAPSTVPLCDNKQCGSMYGICPVGHFCASASSTPTPCSSGSYMNQTGATACLNCPAGHYCDSSVSTTTYFECPQGFYCTTGTGLDYQPCPSGTYGSRRGLSRAQECTVCDGGSYCLGVALTAPSSLCPPGYYCSAGVNGSHYQRCPAGSYCPEGSVYPTSCPPGTYNPFTGKQALTDCLECDPGTYCPSHNLTAPAGLCEHGFYCMKGSNTSTPYSISASPITGHLSGGGVCPAGHACVAGSSFVS